MSLATTGGGVGGLGGMGGGHGGMAMTAHANAMARPAAHQPPPQQGQSIPGSVAPPVSAAALGADLVDKNQNLSLKQARNLSHLPIVAVDLYASEPHVALFPPKQEDAPGGSPSLVGKMKPDIYLKGNDDVAHKTLRKWLTKSKAFASLQADSLTTSDNQKAVVLERPQQWLGLRRIQDAPKFITKKLPNSGDKSKGAIAEEESADVGVSVVNSTLDGSEPQGDDFDRVVCKVRLTDKKKSLAMLPEEGVQILLHQAQGYVAKHLKVGKEDEEEIEDYPCAVALPAWHCHDANVESLLDAMGGSGVVFQRSMCALVGALRPGPKEKPNELIQNINNVRTERAKAYQIEKAKNPDATMEEEVGILLFGMTNDGFECTAAQVSSLQPDNVDCLFGDIKVLCNVSYQAEDPISIMEQCVKEFQTNLKAIMPDMSDPAAIALYGSSAQQESMKKKWDEIKEKVAGGAWKDYPVDRTKPDCISMGTAVLGAVSHGRHKTIVHVEGSKKPKAKLAIRVANVAPVAVGVRYNYHGDTTKKWTPIKTIFDFDRRVPAGPYAIDFKASECVIHRQGNASDMSDEEFLKTAKDKEGKKGIPLREEAALNLRVQIYQKWTRDGEWKKVGDVKKPLIMEGKDGEQIACEQTTLELSLGPTGVITAGLFGEG